MKILLSTCLLLLTAHLIEASINPIILTETIDPLYQKNRRIRITNEKQWYFKQGKVQNLKSQTLDTSQWRRMSPRDITNEMVYKEDFFEGWFKTKIQVDETFQDSIFYLDIVSKFAAFEIFLDGNLVNTVGELDDFKSVNTYLNPTMTRLNIKKSKSYDLAIHFKIDVPYPVFQKFIHISNLYILVAIANTESRTMFWKNDLRNQFYETLGLTSFVVVCIFFWLLALYVPKQPIYISIALLTTLLTTTGLITSRFLAFESEIRYWVIYGIILSIMEFVLAYLIFRIITHLFEKYNKIHIRILQISVLVGILFLFINDDGWIGKSIFLLLNGFSLYYMIRYYREIHGAKKRLFVGILISFVLYILIALVILLVGDLSLIRNPIIILLITFTLPVILMLYIAYYFKENLETINLKANELLRLSEEKKAILKNQNERLEREVYERTSDLNQSLEDLKATQAQLIQSEKMASLGEVTAGIAHEIQNPLNFVNNFSEVSAELVEELEEELNNGEIEEAKLITSDLKQNLKKINLHGKRAESIVKSMLLHSRSTKGEKVPTDINALCDEFLRLSYHGLRAKNRSFNAEFELDFDESIPKIEVVPQDIGRVLLNLFNNAFQAVTDDQNLDGQISELLSPNNGPRTMENGPRTSNFTEAQVDKEDSPKVTVTTKNLGDKIQISVIDNGPGIPDEIKDKIFQPFFTTKPTGQGTGLGLSLAYDIVKAHGGEISVDCREGGPTKFSIVLPVPNTAIK